MIFLFKTKLNFYLYTLLSNATKPDKCPSHDIGSLVGRIPQIIDPYKKIITIDTATQYLLQGQPNLKPIDIEKELAVGITPNIENIGLEEVGINTGIYPINFDIPKSIDVKLDCGEAIQGGNNEELEEEF